MKRMLTLASVVLLGVLSWAAYEVRTAPAAELAGMMPENALVFVEAKDLASLLKQWEDSPQQQMWLKSDDHEVFERSRLYLRLQQAQQEFAKAAGVPPDNKFLSEVAGENSALGIYDIGKMELLYISRMPGTRSMNSSLWQQRGSFEQRESAGKKFYVRRDAQSERVVAFAIEDDYLILGTREDLVAGSLALLAQKKEPALSEQEWYANAVTTAGRKAGELRLAVHLEDVVKTPHFRSYWIQQNITELKQYESSLSDLYLEGSKYREERSLRLKSGEEAEVDGAPVAELMRLVPPEMGFYRAVAAPKLEETLAMMQPGVLGAKRTAAGRGQAAPMAPNEAPNAGTGATLEERIDTPPVVAEERSSGALRELLKDGEVRAVLQLERSESAGGNLFVQLDSTVVLIGKSNWNETAVQKAVQATVAPEMTAATLGVSWRKAGKQNQYYELDGLARIAIAVRGKYLFVSNDPETLEAALARLGAASNAAPAMYYAGFDHARERENFYRMTALIDRPSHAQGETGAQPEFLSQNVASLSKAMAAVQSQKVMATRKGAVERQTVTYQWQ